MKKTLLVLAIFILSINKLMAQSFIITSIDTNPAEVNSDITLNFEYTNSNPNDIIYIGLELLNSDGSWSATVAEVFVNPVGASGTDVAGNAIVSIPSSATPTADLTGGQYYQIKAELNAEAWAGLLAGDYPTITLATEGSLSVRKNQINQLKVYPNPSTEYISFQNINETIDAIKIFSLLGETVYSINEIDPNGVDISNLSTGIYVLSISSGGKVKQTKFLKI